MKIFSIAYWPNIEYLAHIIREKEILIEKHENFIKQTYRNRCVILSPAGPQNLIVPVLGGRSRNKKTITEIAIDYSKHWVSNHLNSIKTAYGSAPFFDFFFDEVKQVLSQKPQTLFELAMATLKASLRMLRSDVKITFTDSFEKKYTHKIKDLRTGVSPKVRSQLEFPSYPQVFEDRFGFVPNLSVLDLVFNLGNEAFSYLKSIKM